MTPGDIVMMLNEMGGLRVQTTSPSVGAASVRIQGMLGRYTRVLFDGLPLVGQQVGGLGLLQIPPMDLGQVEVIKGVASALYGAGAMGGVVNLDLAASGRRGGPRDPVQPIDGRRHRRRGLSRLALVGSVEWLAPRERPSPVASSTWTMDGWADLAGYERGVLRPRVFWDNGAGGSAFLTAGVTVENRHGGTLDGRVLTPTQDAICRGDRHPALRRRRQLPGHRGGPIRRHRPRLPRRGSITITSSGRRANAIGTPPLFGEAAIRGARGRHTWVGGAAFEGDRFDPRDVPRFAYRHQSPGIFAQDEIQFSPWLSLSASGRLDFQNVYGTFAARASRCCFATAAGPAAFRLGPGSSRPRR